MQVKTENMQAAMRLNGTTINGYAGYFGQIMEKGQSFFVIVIPHNPKSVEELMEDIDLKA